jgi:DNA transformation protein
LILSKFVDHTAQTGSRGGAMNAIALALAVPAFAGTTEKYEQTRMDRDFLIDLFADFGPVTIRRMFSGFGISADGINFALALRAGLYFRADEQTIPQFEAEGSKPFQYQQRSTAKIVTVNSYWELPARLFDDSEELTDWARMALAAAQRAALRKRPKARAKKAKAKAPRAVKSAVKNKSAARKKPPRKGSPS